MTYSGAGILLTHISDSNAKMVRFLLLKGSATGIWSFPKGHPENIDRNNPLRTAIRETYEETGYMHGRDYYIAGTSSRYGKRSYWIGIMKSKHPVHLSKTEHSDARWMTVREIGAHTNKCNVDVCAFLRFLRKL